MLLLPIVCLYGHDISRHLEEKKRKLVCVCVCVFFGQEEQFAYNNRELLFFHYT